MIFTRIKRGAGRTQVLVRNNFLSLRRFTLHTYIRPTHAIFLSALVVRSIAFPIPVAASPSATPLVLDESDPLPTPTAVYLEPSDPSIIASPTSRLEGVIVGKSRATEKEEIRIKAEEESRQKEKRLAEEKARQLKEYQDRMQRIVVVQAVSQPTSDIRQFAQQLTSEVFGAGQWPAMDALIRRESNYNTFAQNRNSGAYGIPQALPGYKMASAGSDWQTNPQTQIRWMINYIRARYGTPSAALASNLLRGGY